MENSLVTPSPNATIRLFLFACLALLLGFALPLINVGADDIRMAGVFSLDESLAAEDLVKLYIGGFTEAPPFRYYGGLFFYLPMVVLNLIAVFVPVTEQVVVLTLRGVCTVSGLGCLWMTYRVGRSVFGAGTGVAGAFLLLVSPTFIRWTVEAHPDLPQLFWILCALYSCTHLARAFSLKHTILSSLFAGLAFATKLSGGFLLPILGLAVLLPRGGRLDLWAAASRLRDRRYLLALAAIPAVFLLTFSLTNPFAVLRLQAFVDSVVSLKKTLAFGQTFREAGEAWLWLGMMVSVMGAVNAAGGLGKVLLLVKTSATDRGLRADSGLLVLWILLYLSYLMLQVDLRRSRYLLPILPAALLLSAACYREVAQWLSRRLPQARLAIVVLPILLIIASWSSVITSMDMFRAKQTRVEKNPGLALGLWLAESYSDTSTVLYDAYAYVPAKFNRAARIALGLNYPITNFLEPSLVIVRQATARDFADLDRAADSRIGEQAFRDAHYFYRYIQEGLLPDYRLAKDFGNAAVYERVKPKLGHIAYPTKAWNERVRSLLNREVYGAPLARETMGDIHWSQGLQEEAAAEFRLAVQAGSQYLPAHYKLTVAALALGEIDEARDVVRKLHAQTTVQRPNWIGAVHYDVARRYFDAGYYEDALGELAQALVTTPGNRNARFAVGACHLAAGDSAAADSAYADAVRRHGLYPAGAAWLFDLRDREETAKRVEAVYRKYFDSVAEK
jgi:4-amino-4-deoxy-L-arabinose transferase-like glycosyltransferase